jgi:hypothetical protein
MLMSCLSGFGVDLRSTILWGGPKPVRETLKVRFSDSLYTMYASTPSRACVMFSENMTSIGKSRCRQDASPLPSTTASAAMPSSYLSPLPCPSLGP